jgi:hypothetical protein
MIHTEGTLMEKKYALSMRLCAEEITLTVGESETAQLMQACRLLATAIVQRQLAEVQV